MNKFDKYKIPIFISLNILVLISLFGMAYAYFKATVNNAESASTISIESGELTINYQGNTPDIVASGIVPGWSETKKFTLSGKNTTKTNEFHTDNNLYYKIILAIDNNTFSEGALTYSLAKDSTSSTNGKMADEASGTINQSGNQIIGYGYFTETSTFVDHIYNLTISFPSTEYEQSADNGKSFAAHVTIGEGKYIKTTTFAADSWGTIAEAIKNGQLDAYPVGTEKEVEIDGKSYTVRVANNTKPEECTRQDFSQTACGFVVEFADIVEYRNMNPAGEYKGTTYPDGRNVDGWPGSELYKYANGDFFNKLPSDLQSIIIDTKVVSGHGPDDQNPNREDGNWESTDKIYLLSTHEVWEEDASADIYDYNKISILDTAYNDTRQLDYYKLKGVTTNNYANAVKGNHNYDENLYNIDDWWLRAAYSTVSSGFNMVDVGGQTNGTDSFQSIGFAPAFRIG